MEHQGRRKSLRTVGRRGNAIIEMVLMAPWLFFLFIGVFDFGYYAYSLISVENAARVAALTLAQTTSSASSPTATADACTLITQELIDMANARSFDPACKAGTTLVVTTSYIAATSAADSSASDCGASGCWPAASVSVTYTTIPLIPIPGLMMNQFTLTRTVQVGVRGS